MNAKVIDLGQRRQAKSAAPELKLPSNKRLLPSAQKLMQQARHEAISLLNQTEFHAYNALSKKDRQIASAHLAARILNKAVHELLKASGFSPEMITPDEPD